MQRRGSVDPNVKTYTRIVGEERCVQLVVSGHSIQSQLIVSHTLIGRRYIRDVRDRNQLRYVWIFRWSILTLLHVL